MASVKEKAFNKALVGHGWPSGGLGVGQGFFFFSKTMTLNIFPTVAWTMCDWRNLLQHSKCMYWSLYDVVRPHNIVSLFTIALCRIRQSQCSEFLTTLQVKSHPESWSEYRSRLEGGMSGCQSMEHVEGCHTMCENVNNYPTCQIFCVVAMRSLSFGHVSQHEVKAQPLCAV